MHKKLFRSAVNRKLCGICGGLAEYFDVDPTLIRFAFVGLFFIFPPLIFLYLVGCFIIPLSDYHHLP